MAKSFALFNNLKTYDFEEEDICKIIKILKDRKIIISAIRPKTKESILIDDILESFWNYEESPYVKSMAAETGKIISMSYCKTVKVESTFTGSLPSKESTLEKSQRII